MQPSEEDFREWRSNPVSEWVFGLIARFGERQKELWANKAWEEGSPDPMFLLEAKTRADSYAALSETSYEDWVAIDDSTSQ